MSIHDDARAAGEAVYDAALSGLEAQVSRLSGEIALSESRLTARESELTQVRADLAAVTKAYADYRASHPDEKPPVEEPAAYPLVVGAAVDNTQAAIDTLAKVIDPLVMSRDYEARAGVIPVDQYPWYASIVRDPDGTGPRPRNFDHLMFSVDEDFAGTAAGQHDSKWRALVDSLPAKLPGVRGVISIGNETNIETGADPTVYRAAVEHLIDTFGEEPAPGWLWGTSFSNFKSWGQGRTEGEAWLPRRPDVRFAVSTHVYGKDTYADPADALERSFVPAMKKRPRWVWGVGETSAQEDATHTKKAAWFTKLAEVIERNGGSWLLFFDTNQGGSADINTSPQTAEAVRAIAQRNAQHRWT